MTLSVFFVLMMGKPRFALLSSFSTGTCNPDRRGIFGTRRRRYGKIRGARIAVKAKIPGRCARGIEGFGAIGLAANRARSVARAGTLHGDQFSRRVHNRGRLYVQWRVSRRR